MGRESLRVGDLEIIALSDATIPGDIELFFPDHGPEDWQDYPEYVDEEGNNREQVNLGSYLIVSDDKKVLVDTGIGPAVTEGFSDVTGDMLPTMQDQCGFGPEEVDLVFATHMHYDHIGWHVTKAGDQLKTSFPNAKYLIPKVDWDSIWNPSLPMSGTHAHDYSENAAEIFHLARPIAEAIEQVADVETVTGGYSITDQITTVDTPGHTPGHQSLMIASRRERLFIMGDAIHLPVQMDLPERVMGADVHPQLAVTTRTNTVEWLEREGLMTAVGHFPHPGFGHVIRGEAKRYWQPLK